MGDVSILASRSIPLVFRKRPDGGLIFYPIDTEISSRRLISCLPVDVVVTWGATTADVFGFRRKVISTLMHRLL